MDPDLELDPDLEPDDPDPLVRGTDLRTRIRTKMSRIPLNTDCLYDDDADEI